MLCAAVCSTRDDSRYWPSSHVTVICLTLKQLTCCSLSTYHSLHLPTTLTTYTISWYPAHFLCIQVC